MIRERFEQPISDEKDNQPEHKETLSAPEQAGREFIDQKESELKQKLGNKFEVLTSHASPALVGEILKLTGKESLSEIKIGYIPTAADHWEFNAGKNKWTKFWTDQGAELTDTTIDLEKASEEKIMETLQNIDVLIIAGGNTFHLARWAKEKHLDEKLVNWNGITVGISAGAILLGNDLNTALVCGDIPWGTELENREGLGMIGKKIWVHYSGVTKFFGKLMGMNPGQNSEQELTISNDEIVIMHHGEISRIKDNEDDN